MAQYMSTYQKDYIWPVYRCHMGAQRMRASPTTQPGEVECKPRVHAGAPPPIRYAPAALNTCICQAGPKGPHAGSMPQRGGIADGHPTHLDSQCGCQSPKFTKEDMAEALYKAAESDASKWGPCQNRPDMNPQQQSRSPQQQHAPSPGHDQLRPVAPGRYGGQFEGPMNMAYSPCRCPQREPPSGPYDYGTEWTRASPMGPKIPPTLLGKDPPMPRDVAAALKPAPPVARVSCAPEAEMSKFDQPNTFMRKLYERYPYLYQILKDTPPEELIAKVFKDRFLSTYQVDYLRMGIGKEQFPKGGAHMEEKYKDQSGDDELTQIPGCSYRQNEKAKFGKPKSNIKTHEIDDNDGSYPPPKVKEGKKLSEYMEGISKLGGEMMTDQLFKLEKETRRLERN